MNYLQEWRSSGVDEELTRLNVTPLHGTGASEYLLYSDALPRRNDGRIANYILKRYAHTEQGGWWCSGIDILTGEEDLWGCFKPEFPRNSCKSKQSNFFADSGKVIKYEHPPKEPTGLFALRVPLHIWQRIASRYNLEVSAGDIHRNQPDLGFWTWLTKHAAVPLCITEGAKKAGALLTAGYAAIALPGIYGGYRTPRDEWGQRIGKSCLIPQLQKLAIPEREIYFTFDQDTKPNTIKAVNTAIKRTGYLLQKEDCQVKVITWNPNLGKGVDDLIALHSEEKFNSAYEKANSLDTWKAQLFNSFTYPANVELNRRYLPKLGNRTVWEQQKVNPSKILDLWQKYFCYGYFGNFLTYYLLSIAYYLNYKSNISIPSNAKLIAIKSPKGTGKTKFLEQVVKQAIANKQKVLVIGHRVRLVEQLCQRFGLNYITQIWDNNEQKNLGYGLCIDSLHLSSQAQFNPADWEDAVVIIDEVEQVLWHGLNSQTCQNNRVAILKSLKTLLQKVLGSQGEIYIADADLSDISLEYLLSLSGLPIQPFVIKNNWLPSKQEAWQIYNYNESTPKKLVKNLEKHIREGGKPFVCLSAQKLNSKWGTCNLEAYLKKQFPHLKILRIDAESFNDPHHPAYGCMDKLNQILAQYDVVLASPVIETGVSIELQGHFTSVWAIAQGIQGENSVRQALARVRENIPRHIWVAAYGFNRVGNGSTSMAALLSSGQRLTQLNIRLLQQADFDSLDDLDIGFQAESLMGWAKMAVRFNATMINYREAVLAALHREGHQIEQSKAIRDSRSRKNTRKKVSQPDSFTEAINTVKEQNYQTECAAIATAPDLTQKEYQALKKKMVKNGEERRAQRKYELQSRYGLPVTSQLVTKDDRGWYKQLRLHYFLTVGRQYLAQRDGEIARKLIALGEGSVFLPDFNRSQFGATIGTMEVLGIPILLANPERELKNSQGDLQAMGKIALANRNAIKTTVGIGIAKNSTPVTIIRRFLDKIGYSLKCLRTESQGKKRLRVYQIVIPDDERNSVFSHWLRQDESKRVVGQEIPFNFNLSATEQDAEAKNNAYVQLCLDF